MSFPMLCEIPQQDFEGLAYKTIPQSSFSAFVLCIWDQGGFLPYGFPFSYVYKARIKYIEILIFTNFVTRQPKSFKIIG